MPDPEHNIRLQKQGRKGTGVLKVECSSWVDQKFFTETNLQRNISNIKAKIQSNDVNLVKPKIEGPCVQGFLDSVLLVENVD